MSNVFFTSDLHLGHRLVSSLRGFDVPDAHDIWITDLWDSTVGPRDQVWLLGDLTIGSASQALEWVAARPGAKHLIVGNHDQVHPMHRDAHKYMKSWMNVFDSIQMSARKKIAGQEILLSHFPYWSQGDGPSRPTARYEQWRLPDLGTPLMHGHTHGPEKSLSPTTMHVGIDAWNAFVPLKTVEEWVVTFAMQRQKIRQ